MISILAILAGLISATAVYLLLRKSLVRVIIGIVLLGHAANLFLFVISGLVKANPPLINAGNDTVTGVSADPVPQALILTAIVIGFGVQAFAIVLFKKAHEKLNTDSMDSLTATDSSRG